jgi:hypothetical protein
MPADPHIEEQVEAVLSNPNVGKPSNQDLLPNANVSQDTIGPSSPDTHDENLERRDLSENSTESPLVEKAKSTAEITENSLKGVEVLTQLIERGEQAYESAKQGVGELKDLALRTKGFEMISAENWPRLGTAAQTIGPYLEPAAELLKKVAKPLPYVEMAVGATQELEGAQQVAEHKPVEGFLNMTSGATKVTVGLTALEAAAGTAAVTSGQLLLIATGVPLGLDAAAAAAGGKEQPIDKLDHMFDTHFGDLSQSRLGLFMQEDPEWMKVARAHGYTE